jgi:hypothetical protein
MCSPMPDEPDKLERIKKAIDRVCGMWQGSAPDSNELKILVDSGEITLTDIAWLCAQIDSLATQTHTEYCLRCRVVHPYCSACEHDIHACPGCGTNLPHGVTTCTECN